MFNQPLKAFLLTLAGVVVVTGGAYFSGALDRFVVAPPAQLAALPDAALPEPSKPEQPAVVSVPQPADPAKPAEVKAEEQSKPVVAPSFDIVRAEGDGSLVIAGKASPGSVVEIITGSQTLGSAKASADGDFAIVIDDPLKPGDYQIVLRGTDENNVVAMSPETAIVSIPDQKGGQVLALVEQPGQPSKLITVPDTGAAQQAPPATPAATPPVAVPATDAGPQVAAANPEPAPTQPALPAKPPVISVKAVEIEGNKVFVAGVAPPGGLVRAYANDIMLGETKASPTGEFLVETIRELAIGDYIVRADLIAPNGKDVVARAQVPFSRIEGESIAAVAPPAAAPVATAPQNEAAPAQIAAAPAANGDTAAPLQAVKNGVIIRRGDSLWRISRRVYGHGVRYSTIYLANTSQISDPDRIWPGQIFSVPEKTEQGESADMDAIGDQKTTVEPQAAGSAADASAGKVIQ